MRPFKNITPSTAALLAARAAYGVTNMPALAERLNAYMPYEPVSGMTLAKWALQSVQPSPSRLLQLLAFAPPGDPAYSLGRALLEIGGHALPPER